MSEQLASGQQFRVLNVVGDFTRGCLVMYADISITGHGVTRQLTEVSRFRGRLASPTTGRNSQARPLTSGQTSPASLICSLALGSPPGTPTSRVAMAEFETSA